MEQLGNMRFPHTLVALPLSRESPATPAAAASRHFRPLPPHLAALRDRMRPVQTSAGVLAFCDPRVDCCLPGGGLPLGQLHEIGAAGLEAETGAVAAGFVAGLLARLAPSRPVFWVTPCGDLYAPGLLSYGLDPGRLVLVRPDGDAATLGAMEAALRSGGAAAVVGEVGAFGRIASRRLQLACLHHASTGFVLRRWPYGRTHADREATAAVTRWRIAAAPGAPDAEVARPRWIVALTHARGGRTGEWVMEVADDDTPHAFRVVAALAGDAAVAPASRRAG